MWMIRNSIRAFVAALAPLAVYHGTMTAIALGGYAASRAQIPTPDRAFSVFLLLLAIDAGLLLLGHVYDPVREWHKEPIVPTAYAA